MTYAAHPAGAKRPRAAPDEAHVESFVRLDRERVIADDGDREPEEPHHKVAKSDGTHPHLPETSCSSLKSLPRTNSQSVS